MNCAEVRDELSALLDGEASADVERHVNACIPCRHERDALLGLQKRVAALETPVLPEDFTAVTVKRSLEAVARQKRGRRFGARLRGGLEWLAGAILGGPRPVPATAGAFWRAAGLGGTAFAGLSVTSAFILGASVIHFLWEGSLALTPHRQLMLIRAFPAWFDSVVIHPAVDWLLIAVPLLAVWLIGVRLLGAGALVHDLRAGARLRPWSVAGFFLGMVALTLYAGLGMLVAAYAIPYGFTRGVLAAWLHPAIQVGIVALCGGAFVVLTARSLRGAAAIATAFYGVLAAIYLGDRGVNYVSSVFSRFNLHYTEALAFFSSVSPSYLWQTLAFVVVMASLALAFLVASLGYRANPARVRLLVVIGGVVAGMLSGWLLVYAHYVETRVAASWQYGLTVQRAAGLIPTQSFSRTAVVLAPNADGRDVGTYRLHLPDALTPDNVARLERFVRERPNSLAASHAHTLYAADALFRWDPEPLMARLVAYSESRTAPPWMAMSTLWNILRMAPDARYLRHVNAFADPARFAPLNPFGYEWLALAFEHHGDAAWADRMRARSTRDARRTIQARSEVTTYQMRNGSIQGRLLLNGKPLADVPVRIFSSREILWWSQVPTDQAAMLRFVHSMLATEQDLARKMAYVPRPDDLHPLTAVRTDADGCFHADGLPEGLYVLGVLLDSDLEGWTVHGAGIPGAIALSPSTPFSSVGDVRLTIEPRQMAP